MNTPYPIVKKYNYPILTAVTKPTGRTYTTPLGDVVPSVTTLLGMIPKPELEAWKERLGKEESTRITEEACRIGTTMHNSLEGYVSAYLQGRPNIPPENDEERLSLKLANEIIFYALDEHLHEVWGIEEALYCENIYAGRTDLIGVYRGKPAIIDYKSSRRWKADKYLEGYKMQIAAYNFAHKSMFDEGMTSGVILIGIREPSGGKTIQRIILNKDELNHYEIKWLDLVDEYYKRLEQQKLVPLQQKILESVRV
jgi:hypothetical protein